MTNTICNRVSEGGPAGTMLVDGDVLIFAVTAACQEEIEWGEDQWSSSIDTKKAKQLVDGKLRRWKEIVMCSRIVIALSDPVKNWRKGVLPTYKSNRKGKKPVGYTVIREYVETAYATREEPTLEADDVLGLLATGRKYRGHRVVVTIDKDLRTIPGLHWNPDKPERGIERVDLAEADRNHLMQALTGDRVDGYSGCPGCGPVGAARALTDGVTWPNVVAAYEKAGLTEEEALVQARVARILRHGEYTAASGVKLWEPAA